MTPWDEFDVWMQRRNDSYMNNCSVIFCRKPGFVFVDAPWPDHGDVFTLSIGLICTDGKELFEILNVETVADLEQLTQEDMLHLFYNGNAIVVCRAGEDEILQFKKICGTLIAWIDGKDTAHEVLQQLIVPGEFVHYTGEYFHYLKQVREKRKKH